MLILKRRRDQAVRIGPNITVQVLRFENGAVYLGIEAPQMRLGREDMTRADLEAARAAIDEMLAELALVPTA